MKKLKSIICLAIIFICSSVLLTACGSSVKFKVKFMVDNEEYAVVDTAGNETISMPENPVKDNYVFDGWYWDEDVWQNPFTANSLLDQPLNSDMKVYAKWSDDKELKGTKANFIDFEQVDNSTYKISVSNATEILNLSDYVEVSNKSSWQLTTDIQAINNIPSKIATLNIGNNTYYVLVTAQTGDVQLYTLNIRRRPIYTVSFGEYVEPQQVEEDSYAKQPENPERVGYTFAGWIFDFSSKILNNTNIVALWTANQYEIKYCSNNDLDIEEIVNVTYDENFITPQSDLFTKEYYYIAQFNTKQDGTGTKYSLNTNYPYNYDSNLILYAIWQPVNYRINYNYNQGVYTNNPTRYTIESEITFSNTSKNYYDFDGWYTESEYKNKITSISKGSHGNLDLYAKFTPINYEINYHCNDNEINTNPNQYNIESNFTLVDAQKDYYDFNGWFLDSEFNNQISQIQNGLHGELDLYPKFTLTEYLITVHLNGGNEIDLPSTYNYNSNTIVIPDSNRNYYEFGGWYVDENFETGIEKIPNGSHFNYDIYAKWIPIQYNITYNLNNGILDGTNPTKYTVEDNINLIKPVLDGVEGYWTIDYVIYNTINEGTHGDLNLSAYYNYNSDVFNISNTDELLILSKNLILWDKEVELKNDIDLTDIDINPIGIIDNPFNGTFDGCGHSISNLKLINNQLFSGFFGVTNGANITNLSITNAFARFEKTQSGGILIGKGLNTSVSQVYIEGYIGIHTNGYNTKYIGGIVGSFEGTMSNSYTNINIQGDSFVIYCGGLIGASINSGVQIENCYVSGDRISCYCYLSPEEEKYSTSEKSKMVCEVYGLIGDVESTVQAIRCYNVGVTVACGNYSSVYPRRSSGELFFQSSSHSQDCCSYDNDSIETFWENVYSNWDSNVWNLYLDQNPTLK